MTTSQGVVLPLAAIEAVIGRAFAVRADAKQRAKGVERIEAAVKADRHDIDEWDCYYRIYELELED